MAQGIKSNITQCISDPNCKTPVRSRGMCIDHYQIWYRNNPEQVRRYGPRNETPIEKVMRNIDKDPDTGCWNKSGYSVNGYGRLRLPGKDKVLMHRITYEHFIGPIPDGYWVDHLCRNPRCCNPAHLEAVTPSENFNRGARHRPDMEAQSYA